MESDPDIKQKDRSAAFAIGLMLLVAVFQAMDAVIVRQISPDVHPFMIAFTRALFGLLVFLPWIVSRPAILVSHYRYRHILRAAMKLAALVAYFGAFATAPLADATAIAFTAPVFVTVGAWIFLGEKPIALRMVAVVAGFVGVLIVLRPGEQSGLETGLLLALLGAILTAAIQLILKPMSARDSTDTLVAWNLIVSVPIAIIPAIWFWSEPTLGQWGLLALQGALGALSMWMVTRAFSLADATLIAPLDFLRLPFVALAAFVFFDQTVSLATWIGATVIFASTLLMARSARTRVAAVT